MNVIEKIKEVSTLLESKGIEDSAKEAVLLITETLQIDKHTLYAKDIEITYETSGFIDSLVQRRIRREPIQYILGHVDFFGLKIKVGKGVLIPRPETEIIAEEVIKILPSEAEVKILDLCTGSGCLAFAIAKNFPYSKVFGTDISDRALEYAVENAKINNIKNISFFSGSLYEPARQFTPFDLIVSNPPYIKKNDIDSLQQEIKDWEPHTALDGGEDGMEFYRKIISDAGKYLSDNGCVFLEIGMGQADDIAKIAKQAGFSDINIIKDFAGIERVFRIKIR
ncbi:MAG: peptide chain release factor N(5)-glutamine methyltransferase [Nitrospiraceae bacterium]|nr:peptide chain release factor N(5)-glutamine methyltransferase [Nitrospiraceae bacterium]